MPKPSLNISEFSSSKAWFQLKKEILNPFAPKTLSLLRNNPEIKEYLKRRPIEEKTRFLIKKPLQKDKSFDFTSKIGLLDLDSSNSHVLRRRSCHGGRLFGEMTRKEAFLVNKSLNNAITAMERRKNKENIIKNKKKPLFYTSDSDRDQNHLKKPIRTFYNEKGDKKAFKASRTSSCKEFLL